MKPPTLAIIGLLVAGAGGFFAGRLSTPSVTTTDSGGPTGSPRSLRDASSRDNSNTTSSSDRSTPRSLAERRAREGGFTSSAATRLDAIVRNEDALNRYRLMLSFIDGLAPDDFEAAVGEFRSMGMTEQRFGEYSMLLSAWAKVDPIAALAYAKENTGTPFATDTIIATWATNDPEAAIRWANENHEGEEANPFMVGIIRALASSDPLRATQLLTSMPRSVERGAALDGLLPAVLAQGDAAARDWIESLEDDSLRSGAMMRSAEKFAENDPKGTIAWLMENPSEATQRRMDDVFRIWAGKDESSAMSAYLALPAGENRSNALRGLVTNIAGTDPQQAIALMDQHSADVSERTIRHFAWSTFNTNPEIAVDQIARVQDQESRSWMYRRLVGSWIDRDNAAASQWLQRNAGDDPVLNSLSQRAQR
jgi:hypothetical protein